MSSVREAIREIDAISRDFEEAPAAVARDMKTVTAAVGLRIEADAKVFVPVDTGALQGSIQALDAGDSETARSSIGTDLDYAAYVEYGTRKEPPSAEEAQVGPYRMAPRPYLGRAFDRNVGSYTDALAVIVVPPGFRE